MEKESGQIIPDLESRIDPAPHLTFHWAAFNDLSTDRPSGFGVGAIPFTSINTFAERYGIDDLDEFDRFKRLIRVMDRAFLAWHAEREKKD